MWPSLLCTLNVMTTCPFIIIAALGISQFRSPPAGCLLLRSFDALGRVSAGQRHPIRRLLRLLPRTRLAVLVRELCAVRRFARLEIFPRLDEDEARLLPCLLLLERQRAGA